MKVEGRFLTSGLIVALMLVSGFFSERVFAAESAEPRESITLSPVKQRYELDAGSTKTDELTVVNDGETTYDFVVYGRPYSIHDESYSNPDFTKQTASTDVYQWVQFDKASYRVEAGQTVKIPYTIRVPKDATPGGHYGVLFAETQPKDVVTGNSVARKKRVGMIIYATVKGQYLIGGQSLNMNIPSLQFRAPLTATSRIKNTGNTDFVTTTTYRVSDMFGGEKYRTEQEFAVLPQTTRLITFNWEKAPWFGLFKTEVSASFLDQKHTKSGYVLIAPKWLLIVLAATLVGGVFYAVLRLRRK